MYKFIFIMIAVIMLSACAGNRVWSKADTAREATYLILHTIDWGQTLYIADHPDEYYEKWNMVLRENPSRSEVNMLFCATMLLHPLISYVLDGEEKHGPFSWREWWQYLTIGESGACVGNNFRIGIGFGF
jgi:hypothetical protein